MRKPKTGRKEIKRFKPSRNQIDQAVSNYISNGGRITKIHLHEEIQQMWPKTRQWSISVNTDEFLIGEHYSRFQDEVHRSS